MNTLNTCSSLISKLFTLPRFIVAVIPVIALSAVSIKSAEQNCITFEAPLAGSVFSAPSCTVSLRVDCENVSKVELQARYFPENSDSAVIVSLGTITRPPYKLIWNTHNLPNQLFTGIGILAEAAIAGQEPRIARQEGIFLTHNKSEHKHIPVPYAVNALYSVSGENAQVFDLGTGQRSAKSVVVWNEKGLVVHVAVKDASFYTTEPGKNMADAGLEILVDGKNRRSPHPADSTLFFVVPLSGHPYRIDYRAEISEDGSFRLVPKSERINYPHKVGLSEFKGYDIQLTIPHEAFGGRLPDTVGANMILRLLDSAGHVQKVSLSGGNVYEMYSPFTWTEYYRMHKPLYMNAGLQWAAFFLAGFLLSLITYLIISKLSQPKVLMNFERSEQDKAAFDRMNEVIERELVKKDLKLEYVAQSCGMEPQALNTLIRRNTGFTFLGYLQYCRTEVAKERLRSSRSSEKSIADLCGFSSAMEMEKCFQRFHHITPYKFRQQQQVA